MSGSADDATVKTSENGHPQFQDLSPETIGLILDARYLAKGGLELAQSDEITDTGVYQAQFNAINLLLERVEDL